MIHYYKNLIVRHKLIQVFEKYSNERFLYVCAPGGYGKTVAVKQWLDNKTCAKAIINIDEYDNNNTLFCERFCAALLSCQPQNKTLAEIISHPSFGSAPLDFTLQAVLALSGSNHSVFVIDDLYLLVDKKTLNLLLSFLKRLPENFQIVFISRKELPKDFSALWLKGHLTRITAEDLRFCDEDIKSLYKSRGHFITAKQAADIGRLTNGWAIGINALLIAGGDKSNELSDLVNEHIEDFIRTQIWENWDEKDRDFLLRTAMARELNPSLCNLLTGVKNSEAILERLMKNGAFISRSGSAKAEGIYRYHHLFLDFLKKMVFSKGQDFVNSLTETEGQWYLSRNDFYNAADCFIMCKNHEGIAQCFNFLDIRSDFDIGRTMPIFKHPEVINAAQKYPHLLYSLAWCAYAEGRIEDMCSYMDRFYASIPDIVARDPSHANSIYSMRFYQYFMDCRISFMELICEMDSLSAIGGLPVYKGSVSSHMPSVHRGVMDFSDLTIGDFEENHKKFTDKIKWMFGEEFDMLSNTLAANLLYELGSLEKSYKHALTANAQINSNFTPESKFCAMATFVTVLDSLEHVNDANRIIKQIAVVIEKDRAYYLNNNFNALLVRRKILHGDTKAAACWLSEHESASQEPVSLYKIYFLTTICRAYIVNEEYNPAIILLNKILHLVRAYNRTLDIIETLILLSIAYWKKKRNFQDEALGFLEEAVSIAFKYKYNQIFINDAVQLAGAMRRLQKQIEQRKDKKSDMLSFIKMLNLKMPVKNIFIAGDTKITYTEKQKAVMSLLCRGKSYKEMTNLLGITLPTLRSHISLIYKKLDVMDQKEAVLKIQTLNLLK